MSSRSMLKSNLDLHLKGESLGQTGAGVRQETAQVSQQVGGNKRQKEKTQTQTFSERLAPSNPYWDIYNLNVEITQVQGLSFYVGNDYFKFEIMLI